jgi:hypothetical protein
MSHFKIRSEKYLGFVILHSIRVRGETEYFCRRNHGLLPSFRMTRSARGLPQKSEPRRNARESRAGKRLICVIIEARKGLPKNSSMPLKVKGTRYSLVKGERIVRSVLDTRQIPLTRKTNHLSQMFNESVRGLGLRDLHCVFGCLTILKSHQIARRLGDFFKTNPK